MKVYLLFSLILTPVASLANSSREYEKRLHQIYLKHYKNPVSYSEWNQQIQNLPKKHKLKHKDNMWDLSSDFFKNPLYWSKVWLVNPHVQNPHRIYKGDFLKFDSVSLSQAPTSPLSADLKKLFPNIAIPVSDSKPALKKEEIPKSLPPLQLLAQNQINTEIDFDRLKGPLQTTQKATVPFYLSDSKPPQQAEIISFENYGRSFGVSGESLILRLNQNTPIGTYFTVFKSRRSRLKRSEHEIQVKGIVKISSYIQASGLLYRAQVISALEPLNKKDSLFKGLPPSYTFSCQKTGRGKGLILASPYKDRFFLGFGSLVYLDQGSRDGLYHGDCFYIQAKKTEESRFFKRPYKATPIGQLKVVALSRNKATAIILSAKDSIYIGDAFTGSLEAIELEAIEDVEILDQGQELLENYEEAEDFESDFPEKEEDEDLMEEFEDPESEDSLENPLGEDFEVETKSSPRETGLEPDNSDEELEEEFQFFVEEGPELEDSEQSKEETKENWDPEDFEEIEEEEEIEKSQEELEDINKDLEDFEEIDVF